VQLDTSRERPGAGRLGLIARLLNQAIGSVRVGDRTPTVLDCGGGSGTFAVPLAAVGARVTVVDISADALAILRRRADEADVGELVNAVQGDAEGLTELLGGRQFDLVLAHGILEAVERVDTTFAGIAAAVRPGGLLSVLVVNPAAAVVARALAGEPAMALTELRGLSIAQERLSPVAVERLCAGAGLVVQEQHGIGVFSDLVPGAALDAPGARDALAELDIEAAGRSPFAEIAGRVHLLARRPAGASAAPDVEPGADCGT
jgi:S-adenosylmethionine-dependent methyltransferase